LIGALILVIFINHLGDNSKIHPLLLLDLGWVRASVWPLTRLDKKHLRKNLEKILASWPGNLLRYHLGHIIVFILLPSR
jgi:hypothetical protein